MIFLIEYKATMALEMEKSIDKTANEYIIDVCENIGPSLKFAVQQRLAKGEQEYGHQIRPLDNTTTWGTKNDSWLEMAEEEIADAIIYVLTHYLRLVEQGRSDETSFQLTMHAVRQLNEIHHLMSLITP